MAKPAVLGPAEIVPAEDSLAGTIKRVSGGDRACLRAGPRARCGVDHLNNLFHPANADRPFRLNLTESLLT